MTSAPVDPTSPLELVCERSAPGAADSAIVDRFAHAVPLDNVSFYRDEDPDLAARSLEALLRRGPQVLAARFQQADGSEPPFVRVSERASRADPAAWSVVYRGFADRLRSIAAGGCTVVIEPILRESDLARLGVALPSFGTRSDPSLPALVHCTDAVLAAAEASGSADPAWRRLWYFGSVGWVLLRGSETAFAAGVTSRQPDQGTLERFWDAVAFTFEPAFDLAGVIALGVGWGAADVAAALRARSGPTSSR